MFQWLIGGLDIAQVHKEGKTTMWNLIREKNLLGWFDPYKASKVYARRK